MISYLLIITKVTQNNIGMYTRGRSQQTFEIPNNNLDVKFEKTLETKKFEVKSSNAKE